MDQAGSAEMDPERRKDSAELPPELFEMVLLNLYLPNLLLVQSVSKSGKSATETNTKIQQVLFLKPCPEQKVEAVWDEHRWKKEHSEDGSVTMIQPLLNPFMQDLVDRSLSWRRRKLISAALKKSVLMEGSKWWQAKFENDWADYQNNPDPFNFSIQRMLPMQPAARQLLAFCSNWGRN